MKAGFGRVDITPRVGVELSGFGAFITRHSTGVRDRLWARALAVEENGQRAALVSCDLIGIQRSITAEVRKIVKEAAGLPEDALMLHCTHTHSGPNTAGYIGLGAPDEPYSETLPRRIAQACLQALGEMQEARLAHAEVPCEGIGWNREYDRGAQPENVLQDAWRPLKPELTDTTCHVVRFDSGDRLPGFFSYFGCHPVVCCEATRYIHGDYCGVATGLLEQEHPGAVGLFLQGAQGDIDSCVAHRSEQDSMAALDIIAERYARSVRHGLASAGEIKTGVCKSVLREVVFTCKNWSLEEIQRRLAEQDRIAHAPGASDADHNVRRAVVFTLALRGLIARAKSGESLNPSVEIQGIRIGPLLLLGAPFEVFQAIKNDIVRQIQPGFIPLVMGITNDMIGYAPDRQKAALGGYAADIVPLILGKLPLADIHDELVAAMVGIASELAAS